MSNINLYLIKLHNALQYRAFSQATAQYSVVISQKLGEIAEQDLKIAELLFSSEQIEVEHKFKLNPLDVNLECEASDYTQEILEAVIAEEKYLAGVFKADGLDRLYNSSIHRAADLKEMLEHLKDGSLFGHTINLGLNSQNSQSRRDCICTACGYVHRHVQSGSQSFPESCPLCGAAQGLFIRRRPAGGW